MPTASMPRAMPPECRMSLFFKHDDPLPGTHLFGPYSHHHAGTPSADDQHICTQGHVWAAYIVSFFATTAIVLYAI